MTSLPTRSEGIVLARELALLGAEAAVVERDQEALDPSSGFSHALPRFRDLGARMRLHLAEGDAMTARLRGRLGLDEVSYWVVKLAAAAERFPEVAAAFSLLAEDERVHLLTPVAFAKLLRTALGVPFERALAEAIGGCTAERLGLVERVETGAQKPLSQVPLRLTAAEARLHLLGEAPAVESTSLGVQREPPARALGFTKELVRAARVLLDEGGVLCVRAPNGRVARQLGLDLASISEETALVVLGGDEPPDANEVAKLRGGVVVVDLFPACQARAFPDTYVRGLAPRVQPLVLLVPRSAHTFDWPTVDVDELDAAAQRRIFASELGDGPAAADLARRFRVSLDEVRSAVRAARTKARLAGAEALDVGSVAEALLAQGARKMGRLVTHVPAAARFEDLVVPPAVYDTLQDVVSYYRAAPRVANELRLAPRSLGRGLSCLFSGSPGTGKTFAAECLACELGLNLYRIDLSQVVSKYIGETEKALARVFEEAEAGHGILLFDEADALFGKRSDVKDAHDRYANVEVAYLLQRMESFDGISILTTNLRGNIDTAFLRRLRFVVEFPMPDASMRRRLWEQSLPPSDRWELGLDLKPFVERFSLAGGSIHNIGLAAAHLAAAEPDGILRAAHLVRATYRELEKVGLGRSRDDFGPLAPHLPDPRGPQSAPARSGQPHGRSAQA